MFTIQNYIYTVIASLVIFVVHFGVEVSDKYQRTTVTYKDVIIQLFLAVLPVVNIGVALMWTLFVLYDINYRFLKPFWKNLDNPIFKK